MRLRDVGPIANSLVGLNFGGDRIFYDPLAPFSPDGAIGDLPLEVFRRAHVGSLYVRYSKEQADRFHPDVPSR